ncbi:hypothetical protein [Wolbachia endosymbiont of Pentidionis agamae]|uniref:hypothetical protein n=1 Tax=Wolbachia endosymbiont of Pentidionis agamae TaxID=3110435 RepID=UPI002FCF3DB0
MTDTQVDKISFKELFLERKYEQIIKFLWEINGNENEKVIWEINEEVKREILGFLSENWMCTINYSIFDGPGKGEVWRNGDNILHLAARAGNAKVFSLIVEKIIKYDIDKKGTQGLLHILTNKNSDGENAFHIAAKQQGTLGRIIRKAFGDLSKPINDIDNEIKDAESKFKSKDGKQESYKEKIREYKKERKLAEAYKNKGIDFIRSTVSGKLALNFGRKPRDPLSYVSDPNEKAEIKKLLGIKKNFIFSKVCKFAFFTLASVALVAVACTAICFLFACAQSFALSTIASAAIAGSVASAAAAYNIASNLFYQPSSEFENINFENINCDVSESSPSLCS